MLSTSSRVFKKTKRFHIAGIGVFRIKSVEQTETPAGRYVVINDVAICEGRGTARQLLQGGKLNRVAMIIHNDLIAVFHPTDNVEQFDRKQFVEFVNNHG